MRPGFVITNGDGRKQTSLRFLDDGERLPVGRLGGGNILVGDFDLRLK
jgi:hypothetical protein